MKPRRILVPVDFSAGSLAAVRHAQQIAQLANCHLHLLHVMDSPGPIRRGVDLKALGLGRGDKRLRAYHRLAAVIAGSHLDPFRTTGIVRSGTPEWVISGYADEIHADLIVMGIHGEDQTPPHSPGRVIERVLGTAWCPVLAVPELRTNTWAQPSSRVGIETECVA